MEKLVSSECSTLYNKNMSRTLHFDRVEKEIISLEIYKLYRDSNLDNYEFKIECKIER